jgi:hypothetical protein
LLDVQAEGSQRTPVGREHATPDEEVPLVRAEPSQLGDIAGTRGDESLNDVDNVFKVLAEPGDPHGTEDADVSGVHRPSPDVVDVGGI